MSACKVLFDSFRKVFARLELAFAKIYAYEVNNYNVR